MLKFYKTFGDVRRKNSDGMIITGAPVEHLALKRLIIGGACTPWSGAKRMCIPTSTFAGAPKRALLSLWNPKYPLKKDVWHLPHHALDPYHPLMRGLMTFLLPTPGIRRFAA